MDTFIDKTPESRLLTKFHSIQARIGKVALSPKEKEAAQRALERTREELKQMGVSV
ncbi:MAG: hypothetical protein Q7S63_03115 [bacterium]|nr:hypothetical protein [bacterium]